MEKYSKFKDPVTGINPFLQPKSKPITFTVLLFAILKFPIYILFLCGFPVVGFLIKIVRKDKTTPNGLIVCNSASEFDKEIVKKVFKISLFGNLKYKTCVYFPEKTNSNNAVILNFKDINYCDYSIGLKYSNECIYMYGNRILWLIRFLGNSNKVEINVVNGLNLEKATNLQKVIFDFKDKERFQLLFNNK